MLLNTLLMSLLTTLPSTISAPTSTTTAATDPYMCGYVLTKYDSNSFASVSAFDACTAIYYNRTIPDYQDAYAYRLFGGCRCSFFSTKKECTNKANVLVLEGPTVGREDPNFAEPKPKWYNCARD